MKLEKHSHTRKYRSRGGALPSEKYYIQCNPATFKDLNTMDANPERVIVKAIIQDGIVRNNAHVVAKIGSSATITKEWNIGSILHNHTPGFIKYICKMDCQDTLDKYKQNLAKSFCSQNPDDTPMHILIMPYIYGGSMREYEWLNHIDKFKSSLKQVICSLLSAFEQFGFLHSDIHLDNVLIRETKKTTIHYETLGISIPTNGVQICIMDFEHAFINVKDTCTKEFYQDLNHVLGDIMYTLKLEFGGFGDISNVVMKGCFSQMPVREVLKLLPMIDNMPFLGKTKPVLEQRHDPIYLSK